jgi:hypothetical protein
MFRPDQQTQKPTQPPQGIPQNGDESKIPSTQSIVEQLRRSFLPQPKIEKPKKESLPNPPVDEKNQFKIEFPE